MKRYIYLIFCLSISHIAIAEPKVNLSPTELDFGTQTVDIASRSKRITLKNLGQDDLQNIRFKIEGTNKSEFATPTTMCQPLAKKQSCTVNITFTPKNAGVKNAQLTVRSNADSSPDTVALKGIGKIEDPKVSLTPATINFGSQTINTPSLEKVVTLRNQGKGLLKNIKIKIADNAHDEFSTPTTTCNPLQKGESCEITIIFVPKVVGNREATLTVRSNASSSPDTLTLKGVGQETVVDRYPSLGKGMAINPTGEIGASLATFSGGVAVAGGQFINNKTVRLIIDDQERPIGESVVIEGIIAPASEDIGKKADTFVVAFYVYPNAGASFEDCKTPIPEKGAFFMLSNRTSPIIEVWDTNPATLMPLDTAITISDPLALTEDNNLEIYKGSFPAPGFLCVYFGYQVPGGKLVFNGAQTINIAIEKAE